MLAETPGDEPIIPKRVSGVKRFVSQALLGLPFEGGDYDASVLAGASADDFAVAFNRLSGEERSVTVRTRFKIGDLWNALHRHEYSAVRMRLIASFRERLSETAFKRHMLTLRRYGWVAHKWSREHRSDKRGWSFYVENAQGEKVRRRVSADDALYCLAVTRVLRDDGEYFEGAATGDKHVLMRCPGGLPVRDERTPKE